MSRPVTRIISNRADQRGFRPVSSAKSSLDVGNARMPWTQAWLRAMQPEVVANETPLIVSPELWTFAAPPQNPQQVIAVKLPAPMPVAVTLGAYFDITPRFRRPTRFSAQISQQGFVSPAGGNPGVYIVEWGVGKSRQYIVCDLAPGSIQIPVAQFVNVSALVGFDGTAGQPVGTPVGIASAQIYPGATNENARCQYTATVASLNTAVSNFISVTVPPYSRDLTGQVSGITPVGGLVGEVDLIEAGVIAASWNLFAADRTIPAVATPRTAFQDLRKHPLTGGTNGALLRLRTPPAAGTAAGAITFGIAA
jgi:hypothetical protein